mmetsp:Transcript_11722/g.13633  ORF Transcript_11722/g.13633 Transcript_11722/m.13633 type:complete len:607 (-) Transcript_11722:36-1856(-)
MLLGGLKPIRSRLCLDIFTIAALGYATFTKPTHVFSLFHVSLNSLILVLACLLTLITAGLTKRWTISFFLLPIITLQIVREFLEQSCCNEVVNETLIMNTTIVCTACTSTFTSIILFLIKIVSVSLIVVSVILSILFPAVEISQPKGKYNVGIIDLHLPVIFDEEKIKRHKLDIHHPGDNEDSIINGNVNANGSVSVKLLYPTHENTEHDVPYFNTDTAKLVCEALMAVAPRPLNKLQWILHTWQLSKIKSKRNAKPIVVLMEKEEDKNGDDDDATANEEKKIPYKEHGSKIPIVLFSHGLTGNTSIYSYQGMNLASNGYFVVLLDHSDGSAIGMKKRNGTFLHYDSSIGDFSKESATKYVRARRKQADHRATELLAATFALRTLNASNVIIPELEKVGVSFADKLDLHNIMIGGHSFGAATALTVAARRPDLFKGVIAHDPALDWMTDDARKILFCEKRFVGSILRKYIGGTGGYENDTASGNDEEVPKPKDLVMKNPSIHDLDLLFLYSHQWKRLGWGEYAHILDMFRRGQLGSQNNPVSECSFIHNANHSEFSDSCMMIPLWLARKTGVTGSRNPHETAEEIGERTVDFLTEVHKKHESKKIN